MEEATEMISLAGFIESTNLKADCTLQEVQVLCEEAVANEFYGVCISPYFVQAAKRIIKKSPVRIVTVVGFPFGYSTTSAKVEETKKAIISGADEIDMVMNIAAFKSGDFATVQNDIQAVVTACHLQNKICKVIIETVHLNEADLERACRLCADAEADFVKTSTGFASAGANAETIATMRKLLPAKVKIKAAGGIRDSRFAQQLLEAGAVRLGTSAGKQLLEPVNS